MRHINRFIYNIKYFIQDSLAETGLDPETIAKRISLSLIKERNSEIERSHMAEFILASEINEIIHFTHFKNIKSIINYGLIPRHYLEEEAIRIAINPVFSDSKRLDGESDANCLSISFPNYSMLYSKRIKEKEDWIILIINPEVIIEHKCMFSNINAAAKDASIISGVAGIKKIFNNNIVRKSNNLPSSYTTHPQAEVLEYSVISPANINKIILISDKYKNFITKLAQRYNIEVVIDNSYFKPRKDYKYWKKKSNKFVGLQEDINTYGSHKKLDKNIRNNHARWRKSSLEVSPLNKGEQQVINRIEKGLDLNEAHLINNITIPTHDGGTTQIDHVLVSQYGIFVIETKDYSGSISGSKREEKWTQTFPNKEFQFQNPLHQNYKHILELKKEFSSLSKDIFKSLIVFTDRSEFKSSLPANIIHLQDLLKYLKQFKTKEIPLNQVHFIGGKIAGMRFKACKETDLLHKNYLKEKFNNTVTLTR